jgi:hypothetical protein
VSKAWVMIGVSIRLALALGLHLRNEDPSGSEMAKEIHVHTWWSLHSIECLVSTMTGRPTAVPVEDCTVPLPASLAEHQRSKESSRDSRRTLNEHTASMAEQSASNASRHLVSRIKLTLIKQKVLINLYSPRTAVQSWEVRCSRCYKLRDYRTNF